MVLFIGPKLIILLILGWDHMLSDVNIVNETGQGSEVLLGLGRCLEFDVLGHAQLVGDEYSDKDQLTKYELDTLG